MKATSITIMANFDDDAGVWVATSEDIDGLALEADTLEHLKQKIGPALQDLLELDADPSGLSVIPVHIRTESVSVVKNPKVSASDGRLPERA